MRRFEIICVLFALFILIGCKENKGKQLLTPWGSPMVEGIDSAKNGFRLNDIINNGELIMLTLNGPENYYDYHGQGMGLEYKLCEKFCQSIGVSLRVEACRDTMEMIAKLKKGEGDIIAFSLPKTIKNVLFCGVHDVAKNTSWAVESGNKELADTLNHWFKPNMIGQIKKQEEWLLSSRSVVRHVYSPMLNRSAGIISPYDHLFQEYALVAHWDWRLLAAQCYQESTFDPKAHSWAGACGLMQILPSTASRLGLPVNQLYEPESNIAAAVKYISQLDYKFRDIPSLDRIYYILSSYNCGYNHIRDAMALTKKYGRNPYMWSDVEPFVLKLREAQYYNDPIVRHGYMRSDETVDYVQRIRARWNEYRGISGGNGFSSSFGSMAPQRATKRYRFHI